MGTATRPDVVEVIDLSSDSETEDDRHDGGVKLKAPLQAPMQELSGSQVSVGASRREVEDAAGVTQRAVERNVERNAEGHARTQTRIPFQPQNQQQIAQNELSQSNQSNRMPMQSQAEVQNGVQQHQQRRDEVPMIPEPDGAEGHGNIESEDEVDGQGEIEAEGDAGAYDDDDELFDDIMDAISSDDGSIGESSPLPEHVQLINDLHEKGLHEFISMYLESERYTVYQLCAAFGFPIEFLGEGEEFEGQAFKILGGLLMRELRRRRKLVQYNTFDDVVSLLKSSRRILVLTGAGISTSLGIPDFRSADGLYNQLAASGLADKVDDPQDVFSLRVFNEDPTIFYAVARSILSSDKRYSPTHAFIRLLEQQGKLLTNFTQNIDNLEAAAGISPDKLVHCHGSFASATCQLCGTRVPGDSIHDEIRSGAVPRCKACLANLSRLRAAGAPGMKRKRSSNGSASTKKRSSNGKPLEAWEEDSDPEDSIPDFSDSAAGVMKPDIVFFGEDLPDAFHDRASQDKDEVDLVIVIGTSLKVAPVSEVPNFVPAHVPQVYISRDPCRHINFDIELLGECDVVVAELCRRAGWGLKHEMLPVGGYQVEVVQSEGRVSRHEVKKI